MGLWVVNTYKMGLWVATSRLVYIINMNKTEHMAETNLKCLKQKFFEECDLNFIHISMNTDNAVKSLK